MNPLVKHCCLREKRQFHRCISIAQEAVAFIALPADTAPDTRRGKLTGRQWMTYAGLFQARNDWFTVDATSSKPSLALTLILSGANIQTGRIVVAAACAREQAIVDLPAISSIPCPPLLAHTGVCPRAGFDAFRITAAASWGQSHAGVHLRTEDSIPFIASFAHTAGCPIAVFTGGVDVTELHVRPAG